MQQGAPSTTSPSHIYMRHFIVSWKALGYAQCCGERHVRGRTVRDRAPEEAIRATCERIMECVRLPEEPIKFLGLRAGCEYRRITG